MLESWQHFSPRVACMVFQSYMFVHVTCIWVLRTTACACFSVTATPTAHTPSCIVMLTAAAKVACLAGPIA